MRFGVYISSLLFLLVATRATVAQDYPPPYGGYGAYGGGHASTAEEGIARGFADVVRSAGYANLQNSEASKNYQDAYSSYLDNRLKGTQTYFEMRRMNKQYRESEARPRPTQEDLVRYSESRKPKRLTPNQSDPLTGSLSWPLVLQDEAFAADRQALDSLFAAKAANHGQVTLDQYQKIKTATAALDRALHARIKEYPPQAYVAAKKYVEGLAYSVD